MTCHPPETSIFLLPTLSAWMAGPRDVLPEADSEEV